MRKLISGVLLFCCFNNINAQNVGIGTLTPKAKLHVNDSSVLFTGGAWFLPGTPGNTPVQGSGSRMMWYADKAALRAGAVSGNAWDKDNIGKYSFAAGIDVMAQGDYAVALGVNNKSANWYGFTAGSDNTAAGVAGIAMGYNNFAKNTGSVAIGYNLIARSVYSVALGNGNDTSDLQFGIGSGNLDDRLFQIGNGSAVLRTNAVTILKNGNTGIGTLLPRARLHVDSSVVFSGQALAGNAIFPAPAVEGKGTRFLWYPQKGAARFGTIDDGPLVGNSGGTFATNQWNRDNIGRFSFAAGFNTLASGLASTALGSNSSASGNFSLAVGQGASASGNDGVALGTYNTASGENSVALGYFGVASGTRSTSIGYGNTAAGFSATAIGFGARALANYTVSLGTNTTSLEGGGVSIGDYAITNAESATAIGFHVTASSTQSIVTGKYNETGLTNTLFEIGNGTADNNRKNAFTILNSGNIGIGTTAPQKQLDVVGGPSAIPVALVIGNKGGFGPAALELVSDYGLSSQWRPGYIRSNDIGGFTGTLEFYTNGTGSTNLYGNVKGFEVRNGAALTASGAVGSYSDARLKNNIIAFTDGLNVISQINPVQFYYNADAPFKTDQQQTGIIAQELEKAAPYMVEKNKQNGYDDLRSVNNQAYTFLLINAVKELAKQNAGLQKRIEALERKSDH